MGSYVEEFWSEAYLAPDQSVVLNLNPFFVLEVGYFNFYFYVVLFDFYLFLLRPQSIIEGAVFFIASVFLSSGNWSLGFCLSLYVEFSQDFSGNIWKVKKPSRYQQTV